MKGYFHLWILVLIPAIAGPVQGAKKAPRPDPTARVGELINVVLSDASEKKRALAADELRHYDGQKFPEIVSILAEVLKTDKATGVRIEAAQSLGKIRPVSSTAAQALDQASHKDPAWRVRMQAWTSLRLYHLAGYRPAKKDAKDNGRLLQENSKEPPLGNQTPIIIFPEPHKTFSAPPPGPNRPATAPLAPPQTRTSFSTAIPPLQPRVVPPPLVEGPALTPPK